MNRFGIPLLVFIVLVGFLGVGLTLKPKEIPTPFIDKPAPPFSAPELMSPQQDFRNTDMMGNVWLFNVWASWCVACRAEHPLLNQIAQIGTVDIVGLNYKDNAGDATTWLQQLGNPYSHIPVDQNGNVGIDYGVYGVPETYLIDRAGIIRFKQIGPISSEIVRDTLMPLIDKLQKESS